MPTSLTPYVDGWYGVERELTVIPIPQFPFKNNPTPDIYSRVYDRMYQLNPLLFLPKVANRTAWSNLLPYSEAFDNAAWTKTALTVTADAGTAPDGQTTLDKLLETTATSEHSATEAATTLAAATEISIFAVGGLTRTWIRLAFIDSAATTFSVFFNIASGYVGTKSAGVTSAKIVGLGNGQFRCVFQCTPAAGAGTFKVNVASDGATISYTGNAANGVYLWGAQVTTGTDSPYISTTSTTRAVSAPDRDRTDPMAYLLEEDDPKIETSQSANVRRVFGRVPNQQIVPSSIFIRIPSPSAANGTAIAMHTLDNATDLGIGYLYNGTKYFAPTNAIYEPLHACTSVDNAGNTRCTFGSVHNISGAEDIIIQFLNGTGVNGAPLYTFFPVPTGQYSVISTTVIDITGLTFGTGIVGMAEFVQNFALTVGTSQGVRINRVTDYFLPGVTPGITTAADIPIPTYQGDDPTFVEAILSGATSINYQVGELEPWRGPILARTTVTLNPQQL